MPLKSLALVVLLLGCLSVLVLTQGFEIHNGFLTGEQYLELSDAQQRSYAAGLIDGIFLAPALGAPKDRVMEIEVCVTDMSDQQVAAILTTHLRSKPEEWHIGAHISFYQALRLRCPNR